jgi:hypothetical protein
MNLRLKRPLFLGLLGLFCLLLPSIARADSFDWTYQGTLLFTGQLNSGSGELTTTDGVITGLSGTFNGLAITALFAPDGFFGNDNLLQIPPAPLYVTGNGFSFLDSAGDRINIYAASGTDCTFSSAAPPVCVPINVYGAISPESGNSDVGNFTLEPVMTTPEPGTATMLLLAILFFGMFLRLRIGSIAQTK